MKMKQSRGSPVKLPGQRLIPSSFLARSSLIHSKSSGKEEAADKEKSSPGNGKRPVSLSEFLNRKLHKVSSPLRAIPGKERPFLIPAYSKELEGPISSKNEIKSRREENSKSVLDESVFRIFKRSVNDGGDFTTSCSLVHDLKKRKELSEGDIELPPKRKRLLVIGDDPESERWVKKEKFNSTKQQSRPFYNHYANGGGWWGCDMEGVDNDEVGHNEIWEGVGSTTLGGLDWH